MNLSPTKLSKKQITKAVNRYARRYGYYARTVRTMSRLFYAAIAEYRKEVLNPAQCLIEKGEQK